MPAATDTFQQIAGSGPGPFTQFLRPNIPLDFGQQGSPQSASGYEDATTGTGKTILSFLHAVQGDRRARAEEEDRNTQFGLDNFQKHVAGMLANPDLTDDGRQAIRDQADEIMNQHMHYAIKDVGKEHGVLGVIKNVLTQATGGGMKVREPINWDQATGQITNARRPEHSQDYNFQDIVKRGTQAIADMEKAKAEYVDPATKLTQPQPVTQADYQKVWKNFYLEALSKAPNHADKLWGAAGAGAMTSGSPEWYLKAYAPPIGTGGASGEGPATEVPTTTQPPRPIDTGINPPPGGGVYPALRSGTQHPLTAAAMPMPPELTGSLVTPSASAYFPGPIANTGIGEREGGYAALRRGAQHPLTGAAMPPIPGLSSALTGPLNPPDFTQSRQPEAETAPPARPKVGSTVMTKNGKFKITAEHPDGTFEIE